MHTFLIIFIIIAILICQGYIFHNNWIKIDNYKKIFLDSADSLELIDSNNKITIRDRQNSNELFQIIRENLNRYLSRNANRVSDYHLMKDIVERNCETKEEEINTLIPFPLYLGLMGTMLGIFVGVGFLVLGGGLDNLLSLDKKVEGGINDLLGGVALAMITSVSGILLTTTGAYFLKEAKSKMEQNKDRFLSWIQSELLPELATDISSAMAKMSNNLFRFNETFADNTEDLRKTLSSVNISYKEQAKLLGTIEKLKITQIASANIQVYEKLQNCSEEIDRLGQYLSHTNGYLENVRLLNEKLDDADKRTKTIEKMATFFEKETTAIDQRKSIISQAVGNVDDKLQKALENLQNSSGEKIKNVANAMSQQNQQIENILEEQRNLFHDKLIAMADSADTQHKQLETIWQQQRSIFENKLNETTNLADELKNLTAVKDCLEQISQQAIKQNKKIEELTLSILSLAKTKNDHTLDTTETIPSVFFIPKKIRIAGIICISTITFFCFCGICIFFLLIFS